MGQNLKNLSDKQLQERFAKLNEQYEKTECPDKALLEKMLDVEMELLYRGYEIEFTYKNRGTIKR